MKRLFANNLAEWSRKINRRPLVLSGARQVGKTWILKEFGRTHYAKTAYVNFDRNQPLKNLFSGEFDFKRILTGLQTEAGVDITPGDTLLIFDEIQQCGEALTALKYWQEDHNEYHVACAGSLIGLALQEGTGYPVGKTNSMTLYPMTFGEFLCAVGEEKLFEVVISGDDKLINAFGEKLKVLLRIYCLVGGMPAAVEAYRQSMSLSAAREVQDDILVDYARDFSKHAPKTQVPRIKAIWDNLPVQLAKADKRFVAGDVPNAGGGKTRSRDLKDPFVWLESAGLVYRVWSVAKPAIPLDGYRGNIFKLYGVDVGLLAAKSHLDAHAVLEGDRVFSEFKGALAEQYVQQELRAALGAAPFFWTTSDSRSEVDFLIEQDGNVIPIEVKAEENLQSKSLRSYRDRFDPPVCIRTSMAGMRRDDWIANVPLPAVSAIGGLKA